MDTGLLIIKIITLFYQHSVVGGEAGDDYSEFVDELMENIPAPVETMGSDEQRSVQLALRKTIRWLIGRNKLEALDKLDLLQRLLNDCGQDASTYQALEMGINSSEDDPYRANQIVTQIYRDLKGWDSRRKAKAVIKKLAMPIIYGGEDVDVDVAVSKLMEEIETLNLTTTDQFDPAVVSEVSVSDLIPGTQNPNR